MRSVAPILFLFGYFLGGMCLIWLLVMELKQADPKFVDAFELYYQIWIAAYLPVAIMGTIASARMGRTIGLQITLSAASLGMVMSAMFLSFHYDTEVPSLFVQYAVFAILFWVLTRLFPASPRDDQAAGKPVSQTPE
jgi:hypothetical protein